MIIYANNLLYLHLSYHLGVGFTEELLEFILKIHSFIGLYLTLNCDSIELILMVYQ